MQTQTDAETDETKRITSNSVSISILWCIQDQKPARLAAALTNTATAGDCQTPSGQIPGDEPEQEIDGYGWKDFEKTRTLKGVKTPREISTTLRESEHDDGEELGDDDALGWL